MNRSLAQAIMVVAPLTALVLGSQPGCGARSLLRSGAGDDGSGGAGAQAGAATGAGVTGATGAGGDDGGAGSGGGHEIDCIAQAVHDDSCVSCSTPSLVGVFWNGRECFELHGCACAGEGCAHGFGSVPECATAHARCDASVCTSTGGQWFSAAAGFCGFACGGPMNAICEAPVDACACPVGQTFQPVTGCAPASTCTDEALCRAGRGAWHPASECYCGFTCGQPNDCKACLDSCDCGPHLTFVAGQGCLPDAACSGADDAETCTATGGYWNDCASGMCACGHFECGRPNLIDPCVMPGCDCGALANFDQDFGCVLDSSCTFRGVDQPCDGFGIEWSTCRAGLSCCEHCGAPPGCPSCVPPCCADDPFCEDSGCYPAPP